MVEIIVVGTYRETRAYEAAGLRCFEPERRRLIERVLAERTRCKVLALTRPAYDALPAALARELRECAAPVLAIVPAARDVEAAARVAEGLLRMHEYHGPVAA